MLAVLACTAVMAPSVAAQSADPCAEIPLKDIDGLNVFTADLAVACYNSFPIDAAKKRQQVDALKSYFNLYAYLDLAKGTSAPLFPISVDIMQQLDAVVTNPSIQTEFQFHRAINRAVKSLHDAHAQYIPRCFKDFAFVQPFVLEPSYKNGYGMPPAMVVRMTVVDHFARDLPQLAGALTKFWSPAVLPPFVGQEVVSIDGKDALAAVQEFADANIGQSRSAETRFNAALPSYSWTPDAAASGGGRGGNFATSQTQFTIFQTPLTDIGRTVRYVFRNASGATTTVDAPYAVLTSAQAFVTLQRGGGKAYYDQFCGPRAAVNEKINAKDIIIEEGLRLRRRAEDVLRRRALNATVFDEDNDADDDDDDDDDDDGEEAAAPVRSTRAKAAGFGPSSFSATLGDIPFTGAGGAVPSVGGASTQAAASAPRPKMLHPIGSTVEPVPPNDPTLQTKIAEALTALTPLKEADLDLRAKLFKAGMVANAAGKNALEDLDVRLRNPLASDPNTAFFQLDTTTGVWVLPSFSPQDDSATGIRRWIDTVTGGLLLLENMGMEKLIIDVTNNGGGLVCAGQAFLQYLMRTNDVKQPHYDMRLSGAMEKLMARASKIGSTGAFGLHGFVHPDNSSKAVTKLQEVTTPGRTLVRGGVTSKYSNLFGMDCDNVVLPVVRPENTKQLKRGWKPENIAIVSNGFCGSTCGQFVRALRTTFQVRSYTYGGSTGVPFQPTSFEGGAVLGFQDLLANSDPSIADAPKPFPLPATGSITYLEAYSTRVGDPEVPAEFIKMEAEAHFVVGDMTDPLEVWTQAGKMLTNNMGAVGANIAAPASPSPEPVPASSNPPVVAPVTQTPPPPVTVVADPPREVPAAPQPPAVPPVMDLPAVEQPSVNFPDPSTTLSSLPLAPASSPISAPAAPPLSAPAAPPVVVPLTTTTTADTAKLPAAPAAPAVVPVPQQLPPAIPVSPLPAPSSSSAGAASYNPPPASSVSAAASRTPTLTPTAMPTRPAAAATTAVVDVAPVATPVAAPPPAAGSAGNVLSGGERVAVGAMLAWAVGVVGLWVLA
ncbi:hypothetical protein HDU96_007676 [Phlyctochytrium bullatum]|nr:hypothetical protein HDU96_007676 [Phlyctochytrium bullatum]